MNENTNTNEPASVWRRLRERPELNEDGDAEAARRLAAMREAVRRSCDPEAAAAGIERWLEAGGATAADESVVTARMDEAAWGVEPVSFPWHEPEFPRALGEVFAGAPGLAEYLIRRPGAARPVLRPLCRPVEDEERIVGFRGAAFKETLFTALRETATEQPGAAEDVLRRARVEAMLRIAALDLRRRLDLEGVVRALSDTADGCVAGAAAVAVERLRPKYGVVSPAATAKQVAATGLRGEPVPPFIVFALGKLGGRELNYCSDIDLVFAYLDTGPSAGGERSLSATEYFAKLGEELIALLEKPTAAGRCYPVDMRLRPYGGSGALAWRLDEMPAYLQNEGRTWERAAWLKARAVAGDTALGETLLSELTPFVYQRWLSLEEIGELQALKRRIETETARRGEEESEVKLGRGGLRDIEFAVQFLQLLHGGEEPAVRTGNTTAALRALAGRGYLSQRDAGTAEAAYVFLREIEHRLQFHADRPTHRLPDDAPARRRLALALGFRDGSWAAAATAAAAPLFAAPTSSGTDTDTDTDTDAGTAPEKQDGEDGVAPHAEEAFERARREHVERVQAMFHRLFAGLFPERDEAGTELSDLLLSPDPDRGALAQALGRYGFAATRANAEVLLELGRDRLLLSSPAQTRRFFASAAPRILRALLETGEGEAALRRFTHIAGSLGAKAVFFQMLHQTPWLLRMTAQLAAWSEYLTEILVANPGLFDELVDALRTGQAKTREEMEAELAELVSGGEIADTLRAYRSGELLRIGVRDLLHSAEPAQTQGELSDLAEALLRVQTAYLLKQRCAKRGVPRDSSGRAIGFAVLAVGKFGGRELNYGSDLDVLFFYGAEGATADGTPAAGFFSETAQLLSREMERATPRGQLYKLDARLRPNGSKGPPAASPEAFRRYYESGSLADWERLALTRARFVAGDEGVGERALHLLRGATYSPLRSTDLAAHTRKMRARLEASVPKEDLKRGPGGFVDVEFVVQYLQLRYGPSFPPLRKTGIRAALAALEKHGKLSAEDAAVLREGYTFLTRLVNRLRIVHGLSSDRLPEKPEALRSLARRVGYQGDGAGERLAADLAEHRKKVRAVFDRLVR